MSSAQYRNSKALQIFAIRPRIPRQFWRYLWRSAAILLFGVAILVLLGSFILVRSNPGNLLYPYVADRVSDKATALDVFDSSQDSLQQAFDLHAGIYKTVTQKEGLDFSLPRYSLEQPLIIRVIEQLRFERTWDSGLTARIDLAPLLQGLLKLTGWEGRGVHISYLRALRPITGGHCSEIATNSTVPAPSEGRSVEERQCWQLRARFLPRLLTSPTIDSKVFYGTKEELAKDLAVFVMRGLVKEEQTKQDALTSTEQPGAPTFLSAESIPASMTRLRLLHDGFSDLLECTDLTCLSVVSRMFQDFNGHNPGHDGRSDVAPNPIASLGLALVSLQRASASIASGHPAYPGDLELQLWHMERHLKQARRSHLLRWSLNEGTLPSIRLLNDSTTISLEMLMLPNTRELACALRDYRRARWSRCLERLAGIHLLPDSLQPHFWLPSTMHHSITTQSLIHRPHRPAAKSFSYLRNFARTQRGGNRETHIVTLGSLGPWRL